MTLEFQPKAIATNHHDQFEVYAEGLGRYIIEVSLPAGYEQSDKSYPVILTTDGNILFDIVQVIVHGGFARQSSMLPPAIVVGIAYPTDEGTASWYARRNYDFHGDWEMTDPLGQTLRQIFSMLKQAEGKPDLEIRAGGYQRFISFLRDELLPGLAQRYRIDLTARHTLIGDSSGGHFALRAMYDPHSPFRRYVCISPSFGSANNAIQQAEAEYAASHDDLDVDLFICCGKVEVDQQPMMALCRFGSGVTWIAEQFALRQWPGAHIHWEIMNNEDHSSIAPRAIAAGLRSVHQVRPGIHDDAIRKATAAMMEAMQGKEAR